MSDANDVILGILRTEENLEFYRRIADNLESILTGGGYRGARETPRPPSPDPHAHEDKMVRLMDARDMLEKTEKELEALRAEFNAMLSQVTKAKCRDELYRRFVLGQNYKEIAQIHGQSVDNMYKLRNEGLCMIEGYRPGNYYGL